MMKYLQFHARKILVNIMYGIMTRNSSFMKSEFKFTDDGFQSHYTTLTPNNYESPIVRCIALSRLEIRENE